MDDQLDLFQEPELKKPPPVISERQKRDRWDSGYKSYISSTAWKKKRADFMKLRNRICERCSAPATDVHHRHYNTFKKEEPKDVEVFCRPCHAIADEDRAARGRKRSEEALATAEYEGVFMGYLIRKYGCEEMAKEASYDPNERIEFEEWYDSKREDGWGE